jgi:hypothetical protein
LIAAEAGFVGVVAGVVVKRTCTPIFWALSSSVVCRRVAPPALVKGSIDRFVDSTLRRESEDERLKRLIGEVPEETHPRFGAQPESPDDIAMFPYRVRRTILRSGRACAASMKPL